MTTGERGPTGDHGQAGADGRDGREGQTGATGDAGPQGEAGVAGRNVLTKTQTLVGFLFLVFGFILLATQVQSNRSDTQKQEQFIQELCGVRPELAPEACAVKR